MHQFGVVSRHRFLYYFNLFGKETVINKIIKSMANTIGSLS